MVIFALHLFSGHFKQIDLARLFLGGGAKPHHVQKFPECRLTDVGETAFRKI